MRSRDAPLAARELRRFIVLNGHNDTEKIGILLERIKRRLNIEQGTGNLAPNTLVLTFRHSPVPPS